MERNSVIGMVNTLRSFQKNNDVKPVVNVSAGHRIFTLIPVENVKIETEYIILTNPDTMEMSAIPFNKIEYITAYAGEDERR